MSRNRRHRLTTYVHVADDQGVRHVFGPDDDVPNWARAKITNPKAWGVTVRRDTVKQSDYGSTPDQLLDVVCSQGHPQSVVARFEWNDVEQRWRWTASLAMSKPWHSAGASEDWLNVVGDDRQVVRQTPDGEVQVRLRCRRCRRPDVQVGRDVAYEGLSRIRAAGASEVELRDFARTI